MLSARALVLLGTGVAVLSGLLLGGALVVVLWIHSPHPGPDADLTWGLVAVMASPAGVGGGVALILSGRQAAGNPRTGGREAGGR